MIDEAITGYIHAGMSSKLCLSGGKYQSRLVF